MQQAQPPQAIGARAGARQLGDEDAPRLADDDHLHPPAPVDEQADLTSDGARQQSQFPRLLKPVDGLLREAPVQQAVERAGLAGLEALQVSFDPGDDQAPGRR